jgi:hypothetical protein
MLQSAPMADNEEYMEALFRYCDITYIMMYIILRTLQYISFTWFIGHCGGYDLRTRFAFTVLTAMC